MLPANFVFILPKLFLPQQTPFSSLEKALYLHSPSRAVSGESHFHSSSSLQWLLLPAERGTCAQPRSAANDDKVTSMGLFSSGGSLWGQEQPKAMSGAPCHTCSTMHSSDFAVALGFLMCAILCSVHTPMTAEVHIWTDRNTHTWEGCRGCVNFPAPVCLPCSTIIRTADHEELWGLGCWMVWVGPVPGCRLSLLIKQVNSAIFCTWTLFRLCLILNTLKRLSNTNMDEITTCPLKSPQPPLLIIEAKWKIR